MKQKTPDITSSDLKRVIQRDFPSQEWATVSDLLKDYNDNEINRVQAAILKLANGNIDLVKKYMDRAKNDFRDVISLAEYPGYFEWVLKNPSSEEKDHLKKDDWEQYEAWLNKA